MKLIEVLNSTTDITVVTDTEQCYQTRFTVGDQTYLFCADMVSSSACDVEFGLLSDGERRHDVTGTGNAFAVFAAVQQCVKNLVRARPKLRNIEFTSKTSEVSRCKLYDRIVRKLHIPSWNVSRKVTPSYIIYAIKSIKV